LALAHGTPLVDAEVDWSATGDGEPMMSTIGVRFIRFVRPADPKTTP
jgi:hypothetical protein